MTLKEKGVRIKEIDPTLVALCHFEKERTLKETTPRNFTIRHTWMANDVGRLKNFLHILTFTRPKIPGLFRKTLLSLFFKRLKKSGTYRPLATTADFLQLKLDGTRLRAFYLPKKGYPKGLCVKIIPKTASLADRTTGELKFRHKLSELRTITVPKIQEVSEDEEFLYICEEMIAGQRYRNLWHQKLFATQGVKELCATYKAFGIKFEKASTLMPENIDEKVFNILSSSKRDKQFYIHLQEALKFDPAAPIGTCHHDLLPSNLCVSSGELYFFDWEMVSQGSILADLLKLPFKYNLSAESIKSIAQHLDAEFPMEKGHYKSLFTIYVAERICMNPKKKSRFLKHWQAHYQRFN